MKETEGMEAVAVRGVSLREDLSAVVLHGVANQPGAAADVFEELSNEQIVVDDIMQTVHADGEKVSMAFVVNRDDGAAAAKVGDRLLREHRCHGVTRHDRVSKVAAVGVGMRSHAGVAATMFRAIAHAGANILAVSTSEIVISCIVAADRGTDALRAVHGAFNLSSGIEVPAARSSAD